MPVEVALNTPLAEALNSAIQPKLVEVGWGTGGDDDSTLAEYIILMLVNGKTQDQIASELSGELLNLGPDDPTTLEFAQWLFNEIETQNARLNGGPAAYVAMGQGDAAPTEMDTEMNVSDVSELNAPTGPKAMRNTNGNQRGGKNMLNRVNKQMHRPGDGGLHKVRGSGINTHTRGPPTGPGGMRGRGGRQNGPNFADKVQHGLNMADPQAQWFGPDAMFAMMEQNQQMMSQMQQMQQLMSQGAGQRGGKSGSNRGNFRNNNNNNNNNNNRGQHHRNRENGGQATGEGEGGEDVDMGGERKPLNPDDSVCKFNLNCTNKDCKFAHQSPAAPPHAPVDVNDVCGFGAACKNRKCVGRHPSPAARLAHQGEQDCKFWPNCQNRNCPFKHPAPPCRNGANCTTPDCKFTHVKIKCKFNPCKNPRCVYQHDEGQQGGFKDKVWTAGGGEDGHVSERKYVDEGAAEELVRPEGEVMQQDQSVQDADVIG